MRRGSTLAALAASISFPSLAWSQEMSTVSGPTEVDDIVVTAQRRDERLIDVPIAVTALSDEMLERRQIDSAAGLQQIVPNLGFTATNFGGSNFTLRGIGRNVVGDGADSGVAFHFNGAFLQQGGSINLFYDIDAVEVLRGPQGTLFGRNATGGAINARSKPPSFDFAGSVEAGAGSRGLRFGEGFINLPLTNNLAVRLAGSAAWSDGDIRDLTSGKFVNGNDVISLRASLRWQPDEATTTDLVVSHVRVSGTGLQAEQRRCARDPIGNLGCLPDRLGLDNPNYLATLPGLFANAVGLANPNYDPYLLAANPAGARELALDFVPRASAREWIVTLNLERKIGDLQLSLITNYASDSGAYQVDPDLTVAGAFLPVRRLFPTGAVPVSAPDPTNAGSLDGNQLGVFARPYAFERGSGDGRQWLQEARLASDFSGSFDFLIGAFILDYDRSEDFFATNNALDAVGLLFDAAPPFFRLETPVADLRSYAAFGEIYIRPTDRLTLTGGLRWSRDEKQQANRSLLFDAPKPLERNRLADEAVTGRVVVDWKPNLGADREGLLYASYSRGFKGGGFNPQGRVAVAPTFKPESIDAFELGAKLGSRGLSAGLSSFYYDYRDLQTSKIINQTSVNENIDARMWGAEFEAVARLGPLTIDLSAGYLDSRIGAVTSIDPRDPTGGDPDLIAVKDTETGANCIASLAQLDALLGGEPFGDCAALGLSSGVPVSLRGKRLANAPRWSLHGGAEIELPLGTLTGFVRADVNWRGASWGRVFNRAPVDRLGSYTIVNLSAGVGSPDRGVFGRIEVQNLFNSAGVTGIYLTDATAGLVTNRFLVPARTVSVTLGTRF